MKGFQLGPINIERVLQSRVVAGPGAGEEHVLDRITHQGEDCGLRRLMKVVVVVYGAQGDLGRPASRPVGEEEQGALEGAGGGDDAGPGPTDALGKAGGER